MRPNRLYGTRIINIFAIVCDRLSFVIVPESGSHANVWRGAMNFTL